MAVLSLDLSLWWRLFIYPGLQSIFNTVALPLNWTIGVVAIGLLNIGLIEIAKWFLEADKINSGKINIWVRKKIKTI